MSKEPLLDLGSVLALVRGLESRYQQLQDLHADATAKNAKLAGLCHRIGSQDLPDAEREESLRVREAAVNDGLAKKLEVEEANAATEHKTAEAKLAKAQVNNCRSGQFVL